MHGPVRRRYTGLHIPVLHQYASSHTAWSQESWLRWLRSDGRIPVTLAVYDVLGRLVKDLYSGVAPSGELLLDLDASEFAAGTYILSAESGSSRELKILRKP